MTVFQDEACPHCGSPLPVSGDGGYFHAGDCVVCGELPRPATVPLPDDWLQRKQVVLERAGYQCERVVSGARRCPIRHEPPNSTLEIHHRLARRHHREAMEADKDIHDLDNLVALCREHHRSETLGELAVDGDREVQWDELPSEIL